MLAMEFHTDSITSSLVQGSSMNACREQTILPRSWWKVYALLCKEAPDPSFVVIFEGGTSKRVAEQPPTSKHPEVSPARLLGFLDKIKGFPTLKVSAPEIYQSMD